MKFPIVRVLRTAALCVALTACAVDEAPDRLSYTAFELDEKIKALEKAAGRSDESAMVINTLRASAMDLEAAALEDNYRRNYPTPDGYGPCTVVLDKTGEAIGRYATALDGGNTNSATKALAEAQAKVKQLEDYHSARAVRAGYESARARRYASYMVWIDYQTINPLVGALNGRRPSDDEHSRLLQGLKGEKRKLADKGIKTWQLGSVALFGRPGPLTQEEARRQTNR